MCGIFGIIRGHKTYFDYSTFCTLGIANDSRGGDSCGVFIDGKIEYGVNNERYFENFFTNSALLNETKYSKIALGHCRKASVGAINIATAQPIVIQNDNNDIEFVVLHNGTIYNYKELAEKYIPDINITGMTDSQVMARIFYHKGYDVLSEYNGGSVFFIVDYREVEPKVMFFKGVSKKYYTDLTVTDERPLYFCVEDDELVFSSIPSYLLALRPDATFYTPAANVLGEFKDGKLIGIKKYDRSNCCQQNRTIDVQPVTQAIYVDYVTYKPEGDYYTASARRVHGEYFLSTWGGLYRGKPTFLETKESYFFNGIPIAKKTYYTFILKAFKQSNKNLDDFTNDNAILIRYLSVFRLYIKDKLVYFIEDPSKLIPFTGDLFTLGGSRKRTYRDGNFICETYTTHQDVSINDTDVNLKQLKKLWKL